MKEESSYSKNNRSEVAVKTKKWKKEKMKKKNENKKEKNEGEAGKDEATGGKNYEGEKFLFER